MAQSDDVSPISNEQSTPPVTPGTATADAPSAQAAPAPEPAPIATPPIAAPARIPAPAAAAHANSSADIQALRDQIGQIAAEVAATKTSLDHLNKATGAQFGKIVERFDRTDRAIAEAKLADAKLAKISE